MENWKLKNWKLWKIENWKLKNWKLKKWKIENWKIKNWKIRITVAKGWVTLLYEAPTTPIITLSSPFHFPTNYIILINIRIKK